MAASQLRKRGAGSGFGPVPASSVFLVELLGVIMIIGVAASLALSEYRVTVFKASLTEALMAVSTARYELSERISLTGSWDSPEDAGDRRAAERIALDTKVSVKAAKDELARRGALQFGQESRYVAGAYRLGSTYVLLVDHQSLPGAGILSFRPAVPDIERPTSVTLHCGPGSPPAGWVAPPERVASNLSRAQQPWMCRGNR